MITKNNHSRLFFYGLLFLICSLYWCLDSAWSFISYKQNLNALIFMVPGSFLDTFLLKVSPYQTVSRLSVIVLLLVVGFLWIEFSFRKQTIANALAESEERYRYLITHASEGISIVQDKRIKIPNPMLLEISGYSLEELQDFLISDIIHPEDLGIVRHWYKKGISGEAPVTDTPFRILTKQQKTRWLQLSFTLITWQGKPALLSIVRDITRKKSLEEKQQQTKKMETIGLLAGGVAHDLNNILSGIVTYPEMLLHQLPDDSPLRNQIQAIHESGTRASAIVTDLLTVARGVASSRDIVDLNTLVADFLDTPECLTLDQRFPGVKIITHLKRDKVYLSCSAMHIKKSLMNLLFNAFEAVDQSSGEVVLSTECRDIAESEEKKLNIKAGRYAILSVADTGSGISAEQKKHIFDPFYTRKKMGRSGTGLGLTVVWNTVVDHDGAIDITSSPRGTSFTLYFPAAEAPEDTHAIAVEPESDDITVYSGNGEQILIIDDDLQQRDIASQLLELLEYTPHSVASGEEAVEFLRNNKADLLLLDMVMDPGINGRETYEQVLITHPDQKALIVSGYSQHDEITKAMKLGAGALLKKPYTMQQLAQAVYKELNKT